MFIFGIKYLHASLCPSSWKESQRPSGPTQFRKSKAQTFLTDGCPASSEGEPLWRSSSRRWTAASQECSSSRFPAISRKRDQTGPFKLYEREAHLCKHTGKHTRLGAAIGWDARKHVFLIWLCQISFLQTPESSSPQNLYRTLLGQITWMSLLLQQTTRWNSS